MFEATGQTATPRQKARRVCPSDIACGAPEQGSEEEAGPSTGRPGPDPQLTLDIEGRSEASSRVPKGAIAVVRVSIRLAEGEAGLAAARTQGETLWAIARSLGLVDEKEVS